MAEVTEVAGMTEITGVVEVTERNGAGQKAWLQLISCALAAETGCLLISEGGSVTERTERDGSSYWSFTRLQAEV